MNDKNKKAAFPVASQYPIASEMSLRDYFAGQALAGKISDQHPDYDLDNWMITLAKESYNIADAMMEERNKQLTI